MRVLPGPARIPRGARPSRSPRPPRPPRPRRPSLTLMQSVRRNVLSTVNPQIAALNAGFDKQLAGGTSAIEGYTAVLQRMLVGLAPQMASIYGTAQAQQGAADQALNARLAQVSGGAATDVAQQLAAAGQNAGAFAAPLQQNAVGAAAANQALGTASQSQLIGEGAHAAEYGAKLPGIAGQGGVQRLADLASQVAAARGQAVGDIRSKIPGMVLEAYERAQADRFQRQLAQETLGVRAQGQQQRAALQGASLRQRTASQAASLRERERHNLTTEQLRQESIDAQVARANKTLADKTASAAAKRSAQRTKTFFDTRAKAVKDALRLYGGAAGSSGAGRISRTTGRPIGGAKATGTPHTPYGRAYKQLWDTYAPALISQNGYRRDSVQEMVRHALQAAGYKVSRPNRRLNSGRPG